MQRKTKTWINTLALGFSHPTTSNSPTRNCIYTLLQRQIFGHSHTAKTIDIQISKLIYPPSLVYMEKASIPPPSFIENKLNMNQSTLGTETLKSSLLIQMLQSNEYCTKMHHHPFQRIDTSMIQVNYINPFKYQFNRSTKNDYYIQPIPSPRIIIAHNNIMNIQCSCKNNMNGTLQNNPPPPLIDIKAAHEHAFKNLHPQINNQLKPKPTPKIQLSKNVQQIIQCNK